jgi:phosphatidylinositol 4-kinase B
VTAAPFKLPMEYVEVLGGVESEHFLEFKRLMREGFEAARKHCDSIVSKSSRPFSLEPYGTGTLTTTSNEPALVELMQKDSKFPCFAAFGEQTAQQLRDRFQTTLSHAAVAEFVDRLIMTSMASAWTRLYDSFQYYSQSIL